VSAETFDASLFWPAFRDAGLLRLATVKMRAGGPAVDVDVGYVEPDMPRFGTAVRSRDYEIEYQTADLSKLAEGDTLTVWDDREKTSGVKFRVREAPFVPDTAIEGNDGFFRRALLTKV